MTTQEYYQSLDFAYFKTYSLRRDGALLQKMSELIKQKQQEFDALPLQISYIPERKQLKDDIRGMINHKNGEALSLEYTNLLPQTAHFIKKITKESPENEEFSQILLRKGDEIRYHRCIPFFRDVVVFYNHINQPISLLNICFECEELRVQETEVLEVDYRVYPNLRSLFQKMGHPIENEYI